MDKKRLYVFSAALVLLFIGLTFLFFLSGHDFQISDASTKTAKNGVVDLSGWDFDKQGNVSLDGSWAFYRNQLLNPAELDDLEPTGYYDVPSYWTRYRGPDMPSKGCATYRLIVKTDGKSGLYAIRTGEIYTDYSLWINGKQVDANGSRLARKPIYLHPGTYDFTSESGVIEIVLQVKNESHVYGGIGQSIRLGTFDQIHKEFGRAAAMDLILISICLFAGLYYLILYLFRRSSRELLWFFTLCTAVAVRNIFSNTTLIMQLIPTLPFWIGSKIVTLTIPLIIISMLFYTRRLFRNIMPTFLFRLFFGINIIYGLMVLCLPSYLYSWIFAPYLISVGAACLLGIYISGRAIINKNKEAVFFLAGMLFLASGALLDSLSYLQVISIRYILSVTLFCFIVIQVVLLAKRYAEAYRHAELLSDDLQMSIDKIMNTETAYLSAQMKPHFLYNALNAIAETCEKDPAEAGNLILDLSKYLRQTLDYDNLSGIVPFKKELELLYAYTSIEKARFTNIEIIFDFPDPIPAVQMPPLILQPLVENAIRHGLRKKKGPGRVLVKAEYQNNAVEFTVEDNGAGISEEKLKNLVILPNGSVSIGLYNIHSRLMRLYGSGLSLSSEIGVGTSVHFIIPYQKDE